MFNIYAYQNNCDAFKYDMIYCDLVKYKMFLIADKLPSRVSRSIGINIIFFGNGILIENHKFHFGGKMDINIYRKLCPDFPHRFDKRNVKSFPLISKIRMLNVSRCSNNCTPASSLIQHEILCAILFRSIDSND